MKNLLIKTILLLSFITISSCSGNDDDNIAQSINEVKMTINGEKIIFDNVVAKQIDNGSGGKDVILSATVGTKTDKIISFKFRDSFVGDNAIYSISYTDNGYVYDNIFIDWCYSVEFYACNIVSITNVNNGSKVSGYFSGTFEKCNNNVIEKIIITDGAFNASY